MKKVLLPCFAILSLFLAGCAGSRSTDSGIRTEKKTPPLLTTADFWLEDAGWIPGGGQKITLPDDTLNILVKEMVAAEHINVKDEQAVFTVLKKFFPSGGMMNLWHNKDQMKNFGLAYYKAENDIRLACLAKKQVIRFLLNDDLTFKKKLVVNIGK
jgi:hypothetical protein